MRWQETRSGKYEDYEDSSERMTLVRQFANCVVFSGISTRDEPVLLIVDPWRSTDILCVYESYTEHAEDIAYTTHLAPWWYCRRRGAGSFARSTPSATGR